MQHEMNLLPETFKNVQNGYETVEVRLNDAKRQKVKKGDQIVFYKMPEIIESIIVDVKEVNVFDNFKQLYSSYDCKCFGNEEKTVEQLCDSIYKIYTKEKEDENGVVAIKIKLL